jgi:hypothetical protein
MCHDYEFYDDAYLGDSPRVRVVHVAGKQVTSQRFRANADKSFVFTEVLFGLYVFFIYLSSFSYINK